MNNTADFYEEMTPDEKLREENFKLFEKIYGVRPKIDNEENKRYSIKKALNGEAVLFINGIAINDSLRLNSLYNPTYEAERWADKYELLNRRTTIVLLGFSTGVFLKALKRKLRPDTSFLVYEPEEGLFSFLCGFSNLKEFIEDKNISLFITDEQKSMLTATVINDVVSYRTESLGIITPYYLSDNEFTDACEAARKVALATNYYQLENGRQALKCRIYSWNHMTNSMLLSDLREQLPEDMPAVIVAAGPSLRKNVEVLKRIKNHALIICTDRAVSVLNEYGIVPDAVTSLDADKNSDYLDYPITKHIPLICSHQVNIDAQKLFAGRCIFYHQLEYEKYLLGGRVSATNGLDQGGNVAGGSFVVCKLLGLKTIILIGQDLAYLEGKHHADDNAEGDEKDMSMVEVEGIHGDKIYTNEMWMMFKEFFEREIRMNPELRVIDATEGGARIHGTEIMTLEEVATNVCVKEYPIERIFRDMKKAQNVEEYKETIRKEEEFISDLEMIEKNSKEVEYLCNQLLNICRFKDIREPSAERKLNKLDDLRAPIIFCKPYLMMEEFWITNWYGIPDMTFVVRNNEESIPVFENAIRFYRQLPEDCRLLIDEIKEQIKQGKEDVGIKE